MSLKELYKSQKTVFNMNDLALIWNLSQKTKVQDRARYYAKKNDLIKLKRGVYALDGNYNHYELASKLVSPSYISLETVLKNEGLVFQNHETIYSIAFKNNQFTIDDQDYVYKQIKKTILANTKGLINKCNYWIASKERAFLDTIYFYKDYHFDNLMSIDWDTCFDLVEIYENKSLRMRLEGYHRNYAE